MRNFSHDTKPSDQNIEEILQHNRKRLARQQIIFSCVFVAILAVLGLYLYRRTVYTYYDGYITLDQNRIRAIDDIFVVEVFKKTGDTVAPGDTLFSYELINDILDQNRVTAVPSIVGDMHKLQIQAALASQEIPVLQTRLAEIEKSLKTEENDVYYGLTDNARRRDLEAQRNELIARIAEQRRRISIYHTMAAKASDFVSRSGYSYGATMMPYSSGDTIFPTNMLKYACAPQSAMVTEVSVADRSIVFHREDVITLQPDDYKNCNFGIMAYIPADKVKYLQRNGDVEVIVNDDITLHARLSLMGLRVEEIPKHLVSNFSHDVDAVTAYFTFTPGQLVPFWVLTDRLPVRVRTNNFRTGSPTTPERIFEIRRDNEIVPVDTIITPFTTEK